MSQNKSKPRGVNYIAAERLAQLNAGAEAATLTECLAVDFAVLRRITPSLFSATRAATIRAAPLKAMKFRSAV